MNGAYTYYSSNPVVPAPETPAQKQQRQQAYTVIDSFRRSPPGFWVSNKYEETNHYRGVTYIAIRAIMDVLHCSKVTIGRRKRSRGKSISLPALTKSVASQANSAGDEDYTPVTDHPICRRIERPNPVDTFGQVLSYIALQNRLTGSAPLWTVPNAKGKPVELWALPTALTTPQWQRTPEFPNGSWRVQPYYASGGLGYLPTPFSGSGVIIPNEEVQRFLDPHPFFRHDGMSPQAACAFQLDVLEEIDNARWAAFDHGVTLDAVLQVDGFDDAQIQRIESKMEQKGGGTRNHRRFIVLSGPLAGQNKMNLQTYSNSPKEMDFNQSWEQVAMFVLSVFGVPKSVAGLAMAGSYSELYAALRQFYHRQEAFIHRLAEFLTKALAWPYCKFPGEYRIQIDLPPIQDEELLDKQLSQDAENGTILYNEYRKARNRPTVPGGDVPVAIYLKMKEQELAPDPQPAAPGIPGDPNAAAGEEAAPGAEGEAGLGEEQAPEEQMPSNPEELQDAITQHALDTLGIPPDEESLYKAFGGARRPWEERKHPRSHGRFSSTPGSGASPNIGRYTELIKQKQNDPKWGPGYTKRLQQNAPPPGAPSQQPGYQVLDQSGKWVNPAAPIPPLPEQGNKWTNPPTTPPPLPGQQQAQAAPSLIPGQQPAQDQPQANPPKTKAEHHERIKQVAPKVGEMAANIPTGSVVLASAHRWAATAADKHADRVSAHLGISREQAHHLIRSTIVQLCNAASTINRTGRAQKTYRGTSGKKLKISVKQDKPGGRSRGGPTAGAVPRPENPAGKGSRPPMTPKAMSAYQSGIGAELVPPALPDTLIPLKRPGRKTKRQRDQVAFLKRLVKGLPT